MYFRLQISLMNHSMKPLLLLLSLILVFGCTVEKRLYQRGYAIQWHTHRANTNSQSEQQLKDELTSEMATTTSTDSEETTQEVTNTTIASATDSLETNSPISVRTTQEASADTLYVTPQVQPEGIVSGIAGIGSVGLLVATYFSTFTLLFFFSAIALGIIALVFGIRSIVLYKRAPYLYTNNIAGIIGTVLGGSLILFLIAIIVAIIIAFG